MFNIDPIWFKLYWSFVLGLFVGGEIMAALNRPSGDFLTDQLRWIALRLGIDISVGILAWLVVHILIAFFKTNTRVM